MGVPFCGFNFSWISLYSFISPMKDGFSSQKDKSGLSELIIFSIRELYLMSSVGGLKILTLNLKMHLSFQLAFLTIRPT